MHLQFCLSDEFNKHSRKTQGLSRHRPCKMGDVILLWMAIDPSFVADKDDRAPRKPPMGVRAIPTMQTST